MESTANTGISREMVKALKTAKDIAFIYSQGISKIVAIHDPKKAKKLYNIEDRQIDDYSIRYSEVLEPPKLANYEYDGEIKDARFAIMFPESYDNINKTWLNRLKAGDMLQLHIIRGNNNDYMKKVELHCDELKLNVNNKDLYYVGNSITQDNSARITSIFERNY
jgi:hypothetical protein